MTLTFIILFSCSQNNQALKFLNRIYPSFLFIIVFKIEYDNYRNSCVKIYNWKNVKLSIYIFIFTTFPVIYWRKLAIVDELKLSEISQLLKKKLRNENTRYFSYDFLKNVFCCFICQLFIVQRNEIFLF